MNRPRRWFIFLMSFLGLFFITFQNGFYINTSMSMPRGIYLSVPYRTINPGDIVAVCVNDQFERLGLEKGYLSLGHRCSLTEPLIKQVFAVPGDWVEVHTNRVVVNGKPYFYNAYTKDSHQQVLNSFPNGIYRSTGYWLIGTQDVKSWDSRYFGFVNDKAIIAKLKVLLAF